MKRVILHSDLNNFYASVECVLNPELKDKCIAVCGNEEDRHGIVLAKNQLAKKQGVKTAETIWQAKQKCPNLVTVSPHFDEYIKYSKMVKKIYMQYTDLIEPFGIDECWLDVTGSRLLFGDGLSIAEKIRTQVKEKTGLTVSIGVSFNKVFAKLGSDLKKPDAITEIREDNFKKIVWNLPADSIIGIGKSTADKLSRCGIKTIGDLANTPVEFLKIRFGKIGTELWKCANGAEDSKVGKFDKESCPKSIGRGYTLKSDLLNCEEVWRVIFYLCSEIEISLRSNCFKANAISVSVKNTKLARKEFQTHLEMPSNNAYEIAIQAFKLFKNQYKWDENVRAISVRVMGFCADSENYQMNFLVDEKSRKKIDKVSEITYELNNKYGKQTVTHGTFMCDMKLPGNKNEIPKFNN